MKKVLVLFVAVMFVFSMSLTAKQKTEAADEADSVVAADNIISINAWPYFLGFFNLGYERKLTDNVSIRARGLWWSLISNISDGAGGFFGAGADVFFYPAGDALKGWFVGPRFDSFWLTMSDSSTSGSGTWNLLMLGGEAGYNWVFDGGFSMGIGFGGWSNIASTWSASSGGSSDGGDLPLFGGFSPTFDFTIGFAF